MITILAKLVAKSSDIDNYITYVFVDLESKEYLMCVQFPNWEHRELRLGEIGYLEYKEIRAGVDNGMMEQTSFHIIIPIFNL